MKVLPLVAGALLAITVVPAQASHAAPPVTLSDLAVTYVIVPHDGSGQNVLPYATYVEITVKASNPTDTDFRNVRATLYAGGSTVTFAVDFPEIKNHTALTYTFARSTGVPSPVWCITLGHPTTSAPFPVYADGEPRTGLDTTECARAQVAPIPPATGHLLP